MYAALTGPEAAAKVKTGHICAARFDGEAGERLFWNEKPGADLLRRAFS